jgi:CBS-domain-containing membrane protein
METRDQHIELREEDFERALSSMDTFLDISTYDLMALTKRAQHYASQRMTETRRIDQIMSAKVHTVQPDTPMSEAAHLLVTHRISGLPVVDAGQRLAGIITEADFLRGMGVPVHNPAHTFWQTLEVLSGFLHHHTEIEQSDDPVSRHMVKSVVHVTGEHDLHHALDVMKHHHIKRLPVCDADRNVVGILTRSDLVRVFYDRYTRSTD